jgi:anti-sigma B factor antagonist
MAHRVREERGRLVVSFEGNVDLEYAPAARRVLLDSVKQKRDVLVDLSRVSYIDSSGVANLVEAFQLSRQRGTGFALVSVNAAAMRVLALARLDRVFTIHASLEDGLDGDA